MSLAFRKKQKEIEDSKEWKQWVEKLKTLGIELTVDWESFQKIEGEGKDGPNNTQAANWIWRSGSGATRDVVETFVDKLGKDDFGKQYLKEKVSKVVIHGAGSPEKYEWNCELKDNKEVHFTFQIPNPCSYGMNSDGAVKKLEPLLAPAGAPALSFKRKHKEVIENKDWKQWNTDLKNLGLELVIDFDAISKIPGSHEKEGLHSTWLCGYLLRSGSGVIRDVRDCFQKIAADDVGKQMLKDNLARVIFNVEHSEKDFSVDVVVKDKDVIFTMKCPIPSSYGMNADQKAEQISAHLKSPEGCLSFRREKKKIIESKEYKGYIERAKKIGLDYEPDWNHIQNMTGEVVDGKKTTPASTAYAIFFFRSGSGTLRDVVDALETVAKDELGREALKATFNKLVIKLVDNGGNFEHKAEKQDKTLVVTVGVKLPSSYAINGKTLSQAVEKML